MASFQIAGLMLINQHSPLRYFYLNGELERKKAMFNNVKSINWPFALATIFSVLVWAIVLEIGVWIVNLF